MKNTKRAIEFSKIISIIQMILGVFFLFIFGITTVACLYNPEFSDNAVVRRNFIIICLFFDVLGVMFIIFSGKRFKRIKKFDQETNYITGSGTYNQQRAAQPQTNTARPQTNTAQPQTSTAQPQTNTAQSQTNTARPQTNTAQPQSAPRAQKIQVICECCGGINKIEKGIVSECEYCGSPING